MVGVRVSMGRDGVGKRTIRRPVHTFHLRTLPWQIQPFLIAPVLPGETMRSLMFQSRAVSDPLVNALVGWHAEYYFFYIKHRDLNNRDNATSMMLDQTFDIDTADAKSASVAHYHSTAGVSWVQECLERVVEEYFRAEGELFDDWVTSTGHGDMPIASIGRDHAIDSLTLESVEDNADFDLADAGSQAGTAVMASEVEAALQQWQFQRMNNLTDMTYEDYLKSYGIKGADAIEPHKPELIRFVREWTYPTNTVNPADGAPSSAVSWAIAEKADKDRFFPEPGFIFGCSVFRPKVFMHRITGSIGDLMSTAMSWLPAVLENEFRPGRVSIAGSAAPLSSIATESIIDVRDLLMYGDQFVNFTVGDTTYPSVTIPDDAGVDNMNTKYASVGDAKALFVDAAGTDFLIRQDGVVNLQIASRQRDQSPQTVAQVT